jgi:hypothetical protein
MKTENKKYLVYAGLAVITGAIGYIAYALIFPKKPSVVKNTIVDNSEEVKATPTSINNPFKDMLDNPIIKPSIDWKWGGGTLPPLVDNIWQGRNSLSTSSNM